MSINTRRAAYVSVNPNMRVGKPRRVMCHRDLQRAQYVIDKIKTAMNASSDPACDLALSEAYRTIRNLVMDRH